MAGMGGKLPLAFFGLRQVHDDDVNSILVIEIHQQNPLGRVIDENKAVRVNAIEDREVREHFLGTDEQCRFLIH